MQHLGIIPACAGNTPKHGEPSVRRRDHPRVCGEHPLCSIAWHPQAGSSPRVRGTLRSMRSWFCRSRIIPACAGNTRRAARATASSRDHPRVCGEHSGVYVGRPNDLGSSPRVRGTRLARAGLQFQRGIIPACAGNTGSFAGSGPWRWDHPRVCGEHLHFPDGALGFRGSSPRVRGTHTGLAAFVIGVGIIPACAGNTPRRATAWTPRRDHPRVCGEHSWSSIEASRCLGSSPRVRGTPPFVLREGAPRGIIPACAGNTPARLVHQVAHRDHPRVCGEHGLRLADDVALLGSSPRVRGTPSTYATLSTTVGIIPACAGNTIESGAKSEACRDHPRVCGEHRSVRKFCKLRAGSSPRVRGTLCHEKRGGAPGGIIPACAGNTRRRR